MNMALLWYGLFQKEDSMGNELDREPEIQHQRQKIAAYMGLAAGCIMSQFTPGWTGAIGWIIFALILGTFARLQIHWWTKISVAARQKRSM
jgi:hypothetical protein